VQPDKLKGAIEALKYKVTGCSVPGAMANCPACPAGAMAGAGAAPAADPASYILASVKQPDGKLAATYQLSGMHCTDCEQKVKTALSAVQGVSGVQATFKDNKVVVTYDPGQATPATLLAALQGTGFGVLAADGKAAPALGGCPAGGQCPCMDKDGCKDDAGQDGKAKSGGPDKGGAKDAKKGTTA
jgi:copper chaperone CopZ